MTARAATTARTGMLAGRGVVLLAGALWLWCMLAAPAGAATRALLVGVSELANQPPALWLQAPRNDVVLMRDALIKQGFSSSSITVLADGVSAAGVPDSQHIRDALSRLLDQSARGDMVVLYFSGHGTRLRDATKRYQEPDGLAENFLARDAQLGTAANAAFTGGMRDVDFNGWINAFLARDVFVWSLFDTCSAASMTRGRVDAQSAPDTAPDEDDPVRFRGIRVDQLARPGTPDAGATADLAAPASPAVPRARYVAFFASESHQVTPELRLPRKSRTARPQGLLTWAVAESLARRPATFRELFNGVVALYPGVIDELEVRFPQRELPSPVAEGNLDAPLFANAAQPMTTRPAWPARRSGAGLVLSVGELDGVVAQQAVRVVATLDDGTQRSADAQIDAVESGSARLAVPAALRGVSASGFWSVTPLVEPGESTLRVQTAQALPAGLDLDYPIAIRAVQGGSDADVRWSGSGAGAQRLDVVSPELAAVLGDAQTSLQLPDRAALRRTLAQLAQLKWLARLAALAQGGRIDGFEATLEVWNGDRLVRSTPVAGGGGAVPVNAAANPPVNPPANPPANAPAMEPALAPGERAALTVRNASGHSVDLVIVGMGAGGDIVPVYPPTLDETNRFERGTREQPAVKRFALPWLADPAAGRSARLLVLATPAAALSAPRLFGAAQRDALTDVRVRGVNTASGEGRQRQVFAALLGWRAP